ncbi:MAG: metallophosphoesterase [Ruminococcaceae bacterium]|nr:metallophosphoesterase [Oscillospiraceae bacterium]
MNRPETTALLMGLALASAGVALSAVSERITVRPYVFCDRRIRNPIRLLHVSDLHASVYGRNQQELVSLTDALKPDAMVLTGDICDNRVSNRPAYAYLSQVAGRYPCFYVSGNHEVYTGQLPTIKRRLTSYGVRVLEGSGEAVLLNDTELLLCGIDDPYAFPDHKGRLWEDQLADVHAMIGKSYSILLTHRPERVTDYAETSFDLVLSGHAHGGQVILPGLVNGLYAPHQGFFPKVAGGRFRLSATQTMIVSRGLSTYVRPRVWNRPELGLITLLPGGDRI